MTDISIITTQADYDKALKLIEGLIDLDPPLGSPDADRLLRLAAIVRDYESKAFEHTRKDFYGRT